MCNFIKYADIPSIFSSARVLPGLVTDSPVCDVYMTLWQSRAGYYLRGIKTRDYPEHGSRSMFFFFSFNNNCPQFNCWIVLLSPTGAKHYTWLSWPQLKEYVFFSFKNNCPHFNCYNITQPHSSQTLHVIILASLGERYITFQSLSTLFFAFVFVCWFVCLFFWGVGFACFPNEATRSILHFLSGTLSAFQTSPPNH